MKQSVSKILLLLGAILLITLAFPVSALADGGGEGGIEFSQTINGYTVILIFEKPASVGENPIHIQILDVAGLPVVGADVEVSLIEQESEHVEAETEVHTEQEPASPTESGISDMNGMDESPIATPTNLPDSMPGMNDTDGAPAGTPTSTPAVMSSISSMSPDDPSADHDQMGMVALTSGHESGEYEGEISIESAGDLAIRVHLTIQGELMEVEFPVHVAKSNTGAIVLASFFAVNIALISAAVVMKPKPVSINLSQKA